jgi:type II secretory ATPase GspE/PulE/Tfp pilus assembly ATPase PilB-like protein
MHYTLLLADAQFSGYISIIKLAVYIALFFAWIWLVKWVNQDARDIATKDTLWTGIVLTAGAAGLLLWLLIPIFFIGLLFYIIAVAATSLSYVMHRNAVVPEFDKILTPSHISGLFAGKGKKQTSYEEMEFITSNDNEVPVPEPRTKDFFGFKTAYDLFKDVTYKRASNVILMPGQNTYSVNYILDGVTLEQPDIAPDRVEQLSDFLKQLAGLDTAEKRKPQKGIFKIRLEQGTAQWELTTAGSTAGEQLKLKQITRENILKLAEINLLPQQYKELNAAVSSAGKGIFLISGPNMSGVSTTFYAFLRNHDAFLNSIATLETNPSAELPNVTQETFSLGNSGTNTYGGKLLAMMRTSPDILGAVDIDDAETAKVVCHAAKEGALVYATIEADSVISAIGKMLKLVGDRKPFALNILGASNQRLIRTLCPQCKQAYEPNKDLLRKFNIPPQKAKVLYRPGKVVYDKRGKAFPCDQCHEIGYFGRTCVFETIIFDNDLKKAIYNAKSLQELSMSFRKAKVKFLQEQMLERVLDGTTSVDEMIRVLTPAKPARPRPVAET